MDAKTAVEILRGTIVQFSPEVAGCKPISKQRALEIADLIERLEGVATVGKHLEKHLLTNVNPASQEIAKRFRDALARWEGAE